MDGYAPTLVRTMALLLVVLLGASCGGNQQSSEHKEYQRVLQLTPQERARELAGYPGDRKIDFYLYGVEKLHPPFIWLADEVAKSGTDLTSPLAAKLDSTQQQGTLSNLLYFTKVCVCHDSTVRGDAILAAAVRSAASRTRDSMPRERAEAAVSALAGDC